MLRYVRPMIISNNSVENRLVYVPFLSVFEIRNSASDTGASIVALLLVATAAQRRARARGSKRDSAHDRGRPSVRATRRSWAGKGR